MTIETDIKTVLDNDVTLAAQVGSRNYWAALAQEPTYPNTVTNRIDTEFSNTLLTRNTLTAGIFRADIRAETYADARTVANLVIAAMEAATTFTALVVSDNDVPYEFSVGTYRVSIDFSVWFNT
jgi:hypothetical protein